MGRDEGWDVGWGDRRGRGVRNEGDERMMDGHGGGKGRGRDERMMDGDRGGRGKGKG